MVRDPFAVLVTCGGVHTLAAFRANKLQEDNRLDVVLSNEKFTTCTPVFVLFMDTSVNWRTSNH